MQKLRRPVLALLMAGATLGAGAASGLMSAWAGTSTKPSTAQNSALSGELFHLILIGELELRAQNPGAAYQLLLDAARRSKEEALFRRATDIAVEARAGDQALSAVQAWRVAAPKSLDALRYEVQLLIALNRVGDTVEPLKTLLGLIPPADRAGGLLALPRTLGRGAKPEAIVGVVERVVAPYQKDADPAVAAAAWVALARARLAAERVDESLAALQSAQQVQPQSEAAVLLALELMSKAQPVAEPMVQRYLKAQGPAGGSTLNAVRLIYARGLAGQERHGEALGLLQTVTREAPDLTEAWLTLGALQFELRQYTESEQTLGEFLVRSERAGALAGGHPDTVEADEADRPDGRPDPQSELRRQRSQAMMVLSQAAEKRGDLRAAEAWLDRIEEAPALLLQSRRATLMAQRGDVDGARRLLQDLPADTPEAARGKLMAEATLLREAKRWGQADAVLQGAEELFPNDVDVLYERAMLAEKRQRYEEMEVLLRKVIQLQPQHHHAYNALGYTLADRNVRLPEARALIQRALELAPGEPYLLDSLGWVAYRMGRHQEALEALQTAYASRPDPEIGAHLGEVLWVMGRKDEAARVWREVQQRDAANEVLQETLQRLKIRL